jgi:hypothetical protein
VDAADRGYVNRRDRERLEENCGRIRGTLVGLIRYLDDEAKRRRRRAGSRNRAP